MCQCYTTLDGRVIVCDPCAAGMIEAINGLIPGNQYAADLPDILTPGEARGLRSAVSGWLDGLQSSDQEEAATW